MGSRMTRRAFAIFTAAPIVHAAFPAFAEDAAPEMTGSPRLAIGGYDTVAYHTKNPEKYAAQYDGHCAMGVAYENGHKDTVDPEAFTIVNGKLYVNHTKCWTTKWRENAEANIRQADKNWVTVKDSPEPEK